MDPLAAPAQFFPSLPRPKAGPRNEMDPSHSDAPAARTPGQSTPNPCPPLPPPTPPPPSSGRWRTSAASLARCRRCSPPPPPSSRRSARLLRILTRERWGPHHPSIAPGRRRISRICVIPPRQAYRIPRAGNSSSSRRRTRRLLSGSPSTDLHRSLHPRARKRWALLMILGRCQGNHSDQGAQGIRPTHLTLMTRNLIHQTRRTQMMMRMELTKMKWFDSSTTLTVNISRIVARPTLRSSGQGANLMSRRPVGRQSTRPCSNSAQQRVRMQRRTQKVLLISARYAWKALQLDELLMFMFLFFLFTLALILLY